MSIKVYITITHLMQVFSALQGTGLVGGITCLLTRAWTTIGVIELAFLGDQHAAVDSLRFVGAVGELVGLRVVHWSTFMTLEVPSCLVHVLERAPISQPEPPAPSTHTTSRVSPHPAVRWCT